MSGEERREQLLDMLSKAGKNPVAGGILSSTLGVSRQVIVQDIALLRANGVEILSTNRGYILHVSDTSLCSRVFKLHHEVDETEEKFNIIVDLGGSVKDVFVYHRVYGVVRGELNIKSRRDVKKFMETIESGSSELLMTVTSNYHYHTVTAENEEILDLILEALMQRGFLAELKDYEPVDFWS
ncbi:MAG: transcription repressor NadR [Lachnospiraceae bacterium]|nr:transcription repressor NadR [Lachnospiraceae bacterium]